MPSPRATTPFDKRERPVLHQFPAEYPRLLDYGTQYFPFDILPFVPLLDTFFIISFLSPHFPFLPPFSLFPPLFLFP